MFTGYTKSYVIAKLVNHFSFVFKIFFKKNTHFYSRTVVTREVKVKKLVARNIN